MFESMMNFFKRFGKNEKESSKVAAKERLHLVLAQDRANISADFLEMMKQEIIEVIKKYIDVDEKAIDVRLTNQENEDGTNGAPALYANIPIINIKNEKRKVETEKQEDYQEEVVEKVEQEVSEEETQESNIKEDQQQEDKKEIENVEDIKETDETKNDITEEHEEHEEYQENQEQDKEDKEEEVKSEEN